MEQPLSNRPLAGFRKRCCERFPWLLPVVCLFLETVFWGFGRLSPLVLLVAVALGWMGRDWEGATAPLPIKSDVSEANSFSGGSGGSRTGKVIHRSGFVRASFLLNIF